MVAVWGTDKHIRLSFLGISDVCKCVHLLSVPKTAFLLDSTELAHTIDLFWSFSIIGHTAQRYDHLECKMKLSKPPVSLLCNGERHVTWNCAESSLLVLFLRTTTVTRKRPGIVSVVNGKVSTSLYTLFQLQSKRYNVFNWIQQNSCRCISRSRNIWSNHHHAAFNQADSTSPAVLLRTRNTTHYSTTDWRWKWLDANVWMCFNIFSSNL